MVDVVQLNDGTVVRGTIVEQIPGRTLRIQTSDGSVFVFDMARVTRITREASQTPAQAPPPAPAAPQQPVYAQPGYGQPAYGQPAYGSVPPSGVKAKDPTMGMLFGALIPGGGNFYSGETGKGLMLIGAAAAAYVVPGLLYSNEIDDCYDDYDDCMDSAGDITTIAYVSYGTILGLWAYSIYDGRKAAERYNQRTGAVRMALSPTVMRAPGTSGVRPGVSARVSF